MVALMLVAAAATVADGRGLSISSSSSELKNDDVLLNQGLT